MIIDPFERAYIKAVPAVQYYSFKEFVSKHPRLPKKELEKVWRELKQEMAVELIEKVQMQMPFYGHFTNVNIEKEDVFAAND